MTSTQVSHSLDKVEGSDAVDFDIRANTQTEMGCVPASITAERASQQTNSHTESCLSALSDEDLLRAACEGRPDAFGMIFRRYAILVRSIALRILRDDSEAEDLLQDLFVYVHDRAHIFDRNKSSARSWIVQMAYQRAIDRRRYLASRHFYSRVALDDISDCQARAARESAAAWLDEPWQRDRLRAAFHSLTENQRLTLELFFFDGYTLEEIAKKLNQTRGNVKNHYFRGLERLRKEIFRKHRGAR